LSKKKIIIRDISWLSFNARVLQEAADDTVPLLERIKFLGIFSNNLDEFFRVRVAALQRMSELRHKAKMHLEINPESILETIQDIVMEQQKEFERIWNEILRELKKRKIFLRNETQLNKLQQQFVLNYFNEEVRGHVIPLMFESIHAFPVLNDKSIYLACSLSKKDKSIPRKYALLSVPARRLPRFIVLPGKATEKQHYSVLFTQYFFIFPIRYIFCPYCKIDQGCRN
jgi:polyphosphate kinase